jgi:stress response protein YsnF
MYGHNLVAVYSSRSVAETARGRLIAAGIPASDIRLSSEQSGTTAAPHEPPGFLDWLFGEVPPEHQDWYASNVRDGRTALSVHVRDGSPERIRDLLEEADPIDIDEEGSSAAQLRQTGAFGSSAATEVTRTTTATGEHDQRVRLAKEELNVGKRETERRYRIRTYVVERPVEEQVHLRDERVTLERRPVSGDRTIGADNLQEREFEVVERHEEPVVSKDTRATEEVVVRKDVKDRVETVRDKVRETRVDVTEGSGKRDVDRAAAGAKPGIGSAEARTLGKPVSNIPDDTKERVPDRLSPNRKI